MENNNKALVKLPEFFFLKNTWSSLLLDMKLHAGLFNDVVVTDVYGYFPNMSWNKNKMLFNKQLTKQDINNIFSKYKKYDINIVIILDAIQDIDILDEYCNLVLEIGNVYGISCYILDNNLKNYVESTYPNILIYPYSFEYIFDNEITRNIDTYLNTIEPIINYYIKIFSKDIYINQMQNRYLKMAKHEIENYYK